MEITIDLQELMAELKMAFPEIEDAKLKAAMFDLMLKRSGGKVPPPTVPRKAPAKVEVKEAAEPEAIEEEEPNKYAGLVGEPTSWADLAKTAPKKFEAEAAFDFVAGEGDDKPAKATGADRRPSANKRSKKKRETDEFEGMTDLEIAQALTARTDGKKNGGQFTNLGGEGGGEGDEEFVVG